MRRAFAAVVIFCAPIILGACATERAGDTTFGGEQGAGAPSTDDAASTGSAPATDSTGHGDTLGASESDDAEADSGALLLDVGAAAETGNRPPPVAEVYGNTALSLFRLDVEAATVELVGDFAGCAGEVLDIAFDAESRMFGTTATGLYEIDRFTAVCTLIAEGGAYPASLSFVPAGTVDPVQEALVGYVGSEYVRIDPATGEMTAIGSLPPNLQGTGDLVSVIDGPTVVATTGPDCYEGHCTTLIDPADSAVVRNNPIGLGIVGLGGLALWGDSIYAFFDGGIFRVAADTGSAGAFTGVNVNQPFVGAGSTTSAPPPAG